MIEAYALFYATCLAIVLLGGAYGFIVVHGLRSLRSWIGKRKGKNI